MAAPPPPRYEPLPPPRGGFVWAPGHWAWDGRGYAWRAGGWQPERAGYAYAPGRWIEDRGGWRWTEGDWRRHEAYREVPASANGKTSTDATTVSMTATTGRATTATAIASSARPARPGAATADAPMKREPRGSLFFCWRQRGYFGRRRSMNAMISPMIPLRNASTQITKIRPVTMVTDSPSVLNQSMVVMRARKLPSSPILFSSSTTTAEPTSGPRACPGRPPASSG
jgi:hypothetical protein